MKCLILGVEMADFELGVCSGAETFEVTKIWKKS